MLRHREVSRIEGFSDAVFGFALTLLVVSLEVPQSYAELRDTLSGFVSFAATFAVVMWIWVEHYLLFRKFGLEDGTTIFLNSTLLFLVLFFVYPLKFVFGNLVPQVTGWGPAPIGFEGMALADARMLLAAYGAGFVAVFGVFVALYLHAYRQREQLSLDAIGIYDARAGMQRHTISAGIGVLSLLLVWALPQRSFWMAGTSYFLLGPAHGAFGRWSGARRERLIASRVRAGE
jgi:hypothetical protein